MPRVDEQVTPSIRLVRELGSGGMGSVWVADHQALQTQVVVKFMHAQLAADKDSLLRFSREAAAGASVKSPHVVQVFDHGVASDGAPFIVMELLEGSDLAAYLEKNGPMSLFEVEHVISQTCKALSRAHERGIVHRDIKPENIFLTNAGGGEVFVKVLDFGLAKASEFPCAISSATKTGTMMGTPFYMSPEQVVGDKGVDFRTDLWALGVVAFECLTGRKPFVAETIGGLSIAICSGPIPVPSQIQPALSPELDGWFATACARKATSRFHSAKEMAEALHLLVIGPRSNRKRFSGEPADASPSPFAPTQAVTPHAPAIPAAPKVPAVATEPAPALGVSTRAPVSGAIAVSAKTRSKGAGLAIAGTALLVTTAMVGIQFATRSPPAQPAAIAPVLEPGPPVAPGVGLSAAPAPSVTETVAHLGLPEAGTGSATDRPSRTEARLPAPARVTRGPALPPVAAPPARMAAPTPAPTPNCDPPTWTDENGHVHIKQGCQ